MYFAIRNPNPDDERHEEIFYIRRDEITQFYIEQYETRKLGRWYRLIIFMKHPPKIVIRDENKVFISKIIDEILGGIPKGKGGPCTLLQKSE